MYLFTVVINECSSKFHDTKGVIRNQKSKKDRHLYGRKKNDKRKNNDL